MAKYLNARGLRILDALDHVAKAVRATPAQVALAWLMARPGVTAAHRERDVDSRSSPSWSRRRGSSSTPTSMRSLDAASGGRPVCDGTRPR